MFRTEYPRPGFRRDNWRNLNGLWSFEIERKNKDYLTEKYDLEIEVPFCPESKLSGLGIKRFMKSVWYRRDFEISEREAAGRVLLSFGAVDFIADVYVNGKIAGSHTGGYTPFCLDITDFVVLGANTLAVNARDDAKSRAIPSGKQCPTKNNFACYYTRTTGIWQTVWLEFTGKNYIKGCKITPDAGKKSINLEASLFRGCGKLEIEAFYRGQSVSKAAISVNSETVIAELFLDEVKLWDVGKPELYDIDLRLCDGETVDIAHAYCGFRTVEIKDGKFYLNGKPVFLRQVLDQGFYPDGIYTAPTAADIEKDIDIAMDFGFNGARPHQKVFEDLYLYYADKKGYLVWSEFPNWGCKLVKRNKKGVQNFLKEWREVMARDYNHPSVIGWCPLNECWLFWHNCDKASQHAVIDATRRFDPARPVVGCSGGDIYGGDVWDIHTYTHDGSEISKIVERGSVSYSHSMKRKLFFARRPLSAAELAKLPKYISEYGGLTYTDNPEIWGYKKPMGSAEEFVSKYVELTDALLKSDAAGFCYTQLTDVEQECNGLVNYDRSAKLDEKLKKTVRECNARKAKCEQAE